MKKRGKTSIRCPLLAAAASIFVFFSGSSSHADIISITIPNPDPTKTMKDALIVIKGPNNNFRPTILQTIDKDLFATPPNNSRPGAANVTALSVLFDGGNIAVGGSTKITLDVRFVEGDTTHSIKVEKTSFNDPPDGPAKARANDLNDVVFSKVLAGGSNGTTFAGISIPPGTWGYFYEFYRPAAFSESPQSFTVFVGDSVPRSWGALSNTWAISDLINDFGASMPTGVTNATLNTGDSMTPELFTGISGILPSSWYYLDGQMVANYQPGVFSTNQVASVLWFISSTAPEYGGPFGQDGNNASLSGSSQLSSGGALAPTPPTLAAASSPTGIVLTWPISGTNFSLETTTVLSQPPSSNVWQSVTNQVVIAGGMLSVTVPFDRPGRFFRLKEDEDYGILSSAGPNGKISPEGDHNYEAGADQEFEAFPDLNYIVDKWYLDLNEVQTGGKTYVVKNIQATHIVEVTFKMQF